VLPCIRVDENTARAKRLRDAFEKRRHTKRVPGDDDYACKTPTVDLCGKRVDDVDTGNDALEPWEVKLKLLATDHREAPIPSAS
jgi:hypothetical protein